MKTKMKRLIPLLVASAGLALSQPSSALTLVSNLSQAYDFGAGLDGVYIQSSSFTTGAQAYRLDAITLDLQVNAPGTVALTLLDNNGGLPGAPVANLGSQFINTYGGDYDIVYTASSATLLQPNTTYWLAVEQTGGDPNRADNLKSINWVSTSSPDEIASGGATIGNDMFYRKVGEAGWTAMSIGVNPSDFPIDAGQFAVNASPVPAPGAFWLLLSALAGFKGFNCHRAVSGCQQTFF